MTTIDLDTILAEGYIAAGVKPSVVATRSEAGRQLVERLQLDRRARAQHIAANASPWSQEDDAYLLAQYRFMSEVEIAQKLGRTQTAVHMHLKRLRTPAPSKHPEEITGRGIEKMLGAELHAICHWIDSGALPGRVMHGGRGIRLVKRVTLLRWCITPENWLRFDVSRVRDPHLKRLIELRQARWGDEWWSTTQVAAYHNTHIHNVNARIQRRALIPVKAGNISGRHSAPGWSHNFILKSEAVKLRFTSGKGSSRCTELHVPASLDQFITQATGAGVPQVCLAKMIGWSVKTLAYWLRSRKGGASALPFVDWRTVPHMPSVRRAVQRFINNESLSYDQQLIVRGVLQAWCRHHTCSDKGAGRGRVSVNTCSRLHLALQAAGVDPFKTEVEQ